jgi:hypothetical protein
MANIVVLGAGVMGSAFTMPLADNGHRVKLVGTHLDADIIEEIHETRVHPRLGSQLRAVVTPYTYDRLGEALQGVDLVVIGVNSLGIDWAGEMLRDTLPAGTPLLFLTKGLSGEGDRLELLPHRLRRHLTPVQQRSTPLLAVGGPLDRRRAGRGTRHLRRCHRRRCRAGAQAGRNAAHALLSRLAVHRHGGCRNVRGAQKSLRAGGRLCGRFACAREGRPATTR